MRGRGWQNLRARVRVNVLSVIDNQDVNRYKIKIKPQLLLRSGASAVTFLNVNLKIKSLIESPQESRFIYSY